MHVEMSRQATAYRPVQILLHWLVVALVVVQYSTSDAIVRTHEASAAGLSPDPTDLSLHSVHTIVGMVIVAAMLLRLGLRWWFGTGKQRATSWQARAAKLVHLSFYVVLIGQGLTGFVASYLWWPASTVHSVLFLVLVALVAGHAVMALWHQMVMRDGTLGRMLLWRRRSTIDTLSPNKV